MGIQSDIEMLSIEALEYYAKKHQISEDDAFAYEEKLAGFAPKGQTSMLQDVLAERKTEVDYFSGVVIRMGKEEGVPTPWNDRLYLLIKSIEGLYK